MVERYLHRVPASLLFAVLAGLAFVRILLLSNHIPTGVEVLLYLIWLAAFLLFLKLVVGIVLGHKRWEYTFALCALLAMAAAAAVGKQTAGQIPFVIFLLSLLGFWVARRRQRRGRQSE